MALQSGNSEDNPAVLQRSGHILDAGIGQDFSIQLEGRTFALSGFRFQLSGVLRVGGHVPDLTGNIQFIEECHHGRGPRAARFPVDDYVHRHKIVPAKRTIGEISPKRSELFPVSGFEFSCQRSV